MTNNNKPEWFEIAEQDGPTQIRKISKTLPISAVLATVLILGVGAVVAQTQQEPNAIALESTTTSVAQPARSSDTPAAQPAVPSTGVANPTIGTMPNSGENEDDDYGIRAGHDGGDDEYASDSDDDNELDD